VGGARHALIEIMGANLRTEEAIRLGETKAKLLRNHRGELPVRWRTFDQACMDAFEQGSSARRRRSCTAPSAAVVARAVDTVKKPAAK